jgi:hypothetical protein
MNAKLIACRVMVDEIRRFLPKEVEVEIFEISQHVRPKQLKVELQGAVDRADGKYEVIMLGYGLCSQSVVGLVAQKSMLVIPKLHDCIGVFLGSHEAYKREMAQEHAYFLTQGYIRGYIADQSGPLSELERATKRYGRERAEKLIANMMSPYKRLVYIRTPEALDLEADRMYSRDMAERLNMRYEEMAGTSELLKRMVKGDWEKDFVVAAPGQEITLEQFDI